MTTPPFVWRASDRKIRLRRRAVLRVMRCIHSSIRPSRLDMLSVFSSFRAQNSNLNLRTRNEVSAVLQVSAELCCNKQQEHPAAVLFLTVYWEKHRISHGIWETVYRTPTAPSTRALRQKLMLNPSKSRAVVLKSVRKALFSQEKKPRLGQLFVRT